MRSVFSRRVPADLRPNRLSEARARHGQVPCDLTVSNPTACSIPYPAGLLAALTDPAGLRYVPDPFGDRAARAAVAATYARLGVEVDPERVLLTASTSEAYGYLFRLLADPGQAVLVPSPSYPLFEHLTRLDAVGSLTYRLEPDTGWCLDFASLEAAPEEARAVVLVHPNNPTGSFVHPDDADRVAALCAARGWALIADEVFLPYPLQLAAAPAQTFASRAECLTFTLGGLSKSVGLPQMKLAWTVVGGPPDLVADARERLEYIADAYLSVTTPTALATPRWLEQGEAIRAAIAGRCRANLASLINLTASVPAVTLLPPAGGWSAVLRVPTVVDEETLVLDLLEHHGVAVFPGFFFDFPGEGYLVVSLLPPEETFAEGARRLLAVVAASVAG